jgi:hypothetical protein
MLPSSDPNIFFMFVIKSKKHVFCYRIDFSNPNLDTKHNDFVEILSTEEQFNKDDVYLCKAENGNSSIIIKKYMRGEQGQGTSYHYEVWWTLIKNIEEKYSKKAKFDGIAKKLECESNLLFISLHD